MPRKLPRTNAQLKQTSTVRNKVFDFMRRFNAREMWTINGAPDTECDEIMCFSWEGGVVLIQTWEGAGGWSIYTEPTCDQTFDGTETALRLQLEERERGSDAPISGLWMNQLILRMLPRMSDQVIDQCLAVFFGAASDRQTIGWRERNKEVRIPVEGMTPQGFAAAETWSSMESAPKVDRNATRSVTFVGWCPDDTAPDGGDQRMIWWEPKIKGGCWYGDRDLEEHPILWKPLGQNPDIKRD